MRGVEYSSGIPMMGARDTNLEARSYVKNLSQRKKKVESPPFAAPFLYATPVGRKVRRWPYILLIMCALIVALGYIFHNLPEYRLHLRYAMYQWLGSRVQNGMWIRGHREIIDFLYIFVTIGCPTLVGAITIAITEALPPVPRGMHREVMRFLKRTLFLGKFNVTYAELFCLMFFLGMNAIWFSAIYSRESANNEGESFGTLQAFGYAMGFNAVFCFSFLLIPATRNCFWMIFVAVDYSHSIKYHRWIGALSILLVVCHALSYYITWISNGVFMKNAFPCTSCDIGNEGREPFKNFAGQVALYCLVLIGATSLPVIRRQYYEVFYYSHHLFLVVLVAACIHFSSFVMWMYPSVCLYVIHRILANSQSRVPCEVVDFEAVPGKLTRIVFRRSVGKAGHYHAGQLIYLRAPMISKTQWHPFSISSSPIEFQDTFTCHVKAIGDWTTALHNAAIQAKSEAEFPLIYVDGFYGKLSDDFQHYPVLVFVAGGIGATPIISMIGKILDCMRNEERTMENTNVYFYWTSRELGLFHEFEPLLDAIEQFDPTHRRFRVQLYCTGKPLLDRISVPRASDAEQLPDNSSIRTRPFHQSSRSIVRQILLFVATFSASFLSLLFIRLGYPVLGPNRVYQNRWPLQRVMELVVMLAGAALGWVIVFNERKPQALSLSMRSNTQRVILESPKFYNKRDSSRNSAYGESPPVDGTTLRHPIVKNRLNVHEALNEIVEEEKCNVAVSVAGIGTWVSGPKPLIKSVEEESATFAGVFDVHSEEFEL